MTIKKYGLLFAMVGFGLGNAAIGCGGSETEEGDGDNKGGSSKGGSSGKGGSGGSASKGGSGGSSKGGTGGSASKGGTGGSAKTGGTGGAKTGGAGGSTGGTAGSKTGGTGGSMPPANPNDGLIGHWKFDEGMGKAIADSSGQNNNGVVVKGGVASAPDLDAPTWGEGKVGKGLKLNGVDEWVRIPDSDSLDSTGINNAVSIAAWVKIDQLNTLKDYNFVMLRHEVGTRIEHFGLGMFQGLPVGAIHFFYATGPQNVPLGEWVHLAQTYDGITQRVYMNGTEVAFLDVGWPIAADDTPVTIGAAINEEDAIEQIAGTVDEVRLYNRELTAAEVGNLAK